MDLPKLGLFLITLSGLRGVYPAPTVLDGTDGTGAPGDAPRAREPDNRGRSSQETDRETKTADLLRLNNYLTHFNYIPPAPASLVEDDAALEERLREPIRNFQRYFRLQETGAINQETLKAIKRPRCGLGEPSPTPEEDSGRRTKRYAVSGAKWGKQELTFSVMNTPTYNIMPKKKVNWAIWNALKMWSSVIPVSFTKVSPWEPADIIIKFASYHHGDSFPFDGPNGTIAHAYLPNGRFGDLDGDIHLDDSEAFNNHGRWGYNLYKVLAHELGHSLGLDHSAVRGSIMLPDYQGFTEKPFLLHNDDVRAVQVLYGFYDAQVQSSKPECDKAYDATIMISGKLHIFKNNRVWLLNKNGKLKTKALGTRGKKMFHNFPGNIDSGYQRPSDGYTVFFKGDSYWLYSGQYLLSGYPRPITDYGIPKGIEATLNLREFNKTYFFKENNVWRYDEYTKTVDPGYPHPTNSVFTGITPPLSATFQYGDGYSYFVTDKTYQRYNPYLRNADPGYPRYFSQDFMKC